MKLLRAWDGCTAEYAMGQKRPQRCEHGAVFGPPTDKPKRRSTLKPGKGFSASKAQREKVRGMPCVACGRMESFAVGEGVLTVDPAHLWPRGKGGCSSADCVIPLCRPHHQLFDEGRLDLLPRLADSEAWQVEQAHPIIAHGVSPVELVRRLSGGSYEFVKVAEREAA